MEGHNRYYHIKFWTVASNNLVYQIEISIKKGLNALLPPPEIQRMLDSLQINAPGSSGSPSIPATPGNATRASTTTTDGANTFLTSMNSTYGIKMPNPVTTRYSEGTTATPRTLTSQAHDHGSVF